jgi:ribosomal protein S18 acetylase RimI-like enzyme
MENETIATNELANGLERSEADAWSDIYREVPARVARSCRLGFTTLGSAEIVVAANIDVLAFNRVIGLGCGEAATEAMLDEIVDVYARARVPRFFIQLGPSAKPSGLADSLSDRGFVRYNNWVKLYRGVDAIPEVSTDLRIERIGTRHADAFGSIVVDSFGWPATVKPWIASTVGRSGWRHYLAFDGDVPVATGALFARDGYGWIDFAATLPKYRNRGAQTALVSERVRDAASLGCNHLVVETAEDTPDRSSPSYRNAIRYGFQVAYRRPNYLLENA